MPYDPHVVNTAGESIAAGIDEAGKAMAEGFKAMRQRHSDEAMTLQTAHDLAGRKGPDGQPLMTDEMLKTVAQGDPNKVRAVVGDAMLNLNNAYRGQQAQMQQTQLGYEGQRVGMEGQRITQDQLNALAQQKQAQEQMTLEKLKANQEAQYQTGELEIRKEQLDRSMQQFQPQAFNLTDPATGQPIGMVSTSRESAVPLSHPQPQPAGQGPVKSPDGKLFWNGKEWKEMAQPKAGGQQDQRSLRIQSLDLAIAKLQGDAASKGKDLSAKPGWFGDSYQKQIDALQTEREALAKATSPAQERGGDAPVQTPAPQQFKKGQRVKQDGKTYEYDGQNWNEAQ